MNIRNTAWLDKNGVEIKQGDIYYRKRRGLHRFYFVGFEPFSHHFQENSLFPKEGKPLEYTDLTFDGCLSSYLTYAQVKDRKVICNYIGYNKLLQRLGPQGTYEELLRRSKL